MTYKPPLLPVINPIKPNLGKHIKKIKAYCESAEFKEYCEKEAKRVRRKMKNLYRNICFKSIRSKKKDIEDALDYLCTLSIQKRDNINEELFIALEAYLIIREIIARVYENNPNDEEMLQKLYKKEREITARKDKLIDKINNPYPFKKVTNEQEDNPNL
jgi:hypothetical protein